MPRKSKSSEIPIRFDDEEFLENAEGSARETSEEYRASAEEAPAGEALESLRAALEEKTAEAEDFRDRWLRAQAEFENFKRRMLREKKETALRAHQDLAGRVLPTLDNLERALESIGGDQALEAFKQGMDLVLQQFKAALEAFGVEAIESVGEPFDPRYHEAVMRLETDEHPENVVLTEHLRGYMIKDRLLRPAQVVVSALPANDGEKD